MIEGGDESYLKYNFERLYIKPNRVALSCNIKKKGLYNNYFLIIMQEIYVENNKGTFK